MERLRLAELCASTSLFTDLGTGQPVEHGLRTCLSAMRVAEALGLDPEERRQVYYVSLLRFLGCTADAHQVADLAGGDDTRLLAGMAPVTMGSPREEIARMVRLVGEGAPLPRRLRRLAAALTTPGSKDGLLEAHCEVASRLAAQIGLPPQVSDALRVAYARWDGKGVPRGLGGEAIPRSIRVSVVARDVELWARETGSGATREMLRARRGRAYAPEVVDAALAVGIDELGRSEDDPWELVLALEPSPPAEVSGPGILRALEALGDFADLKAPGRSGHSRRVARLASAAGEVRRLEARQVWTLGGAGSVHDVGVVGVPAAALRAVPRGPSGSWERFRLHPMWSERILTRCAGLEAVAAAAGRHHERLDGSGYPAGASGDGGRVWGLLACAAAYEELRREREMGAAGADGAAGELGDLAAGGRLSLQDVEAVLQAAGTALPLVEVPRPAGLTEREVDVLRLIARGSTNRRIGEALRISPKTVSSHVEHIYAKAGVRTRAAATLFAIQHDLLG